MTKIKLSPDEITGYLHRCIGLPVSDVWKGYNTAIFLELGRLYPVKGINGKRMRNRGEITAMLEWNWRLETARSIAMGSFDSERKIEAKIQDLKGRHIQNISLVGRIPEVYISLSGNRWIHTFALDAGQPEWALLFRNEGAVTVNQGKIYFESDNE